MSDISAAAAHPSDIPSESRKSDTSLANKFGQLRAAIDKGNEVREELEARRWRQIKRLFFAAAGFAGFVLVLPLLQYTVTSAVTLAGNAVSAVYSIFPAHAAEGRPDPTAEAAAANRAVMTVEMPGGLPPGARRAYLAQIRAGNEARAAGHLSGAERHYRKSWELAARLAREYPTNVIAHRDVTVSLNKLGRVLVKTGNLKDAHRYFTSGLEVRNHLLKADPENIRIRRDVSVSLENLGDVQVGAGNMDAARAYFVQSLKIREHLARSAPENARAQRDLWFLKWRLAKVSGGGTVSWADVLKDLRAMKAAGMLSSFDEPYLAYARRQVARAS